MWAKERKREPRYGITAKGRDLYGPMREEVTGS